LVARNGSAWGLGPFFRRRGGEEDDHLLLVLNLASRTAMVAIGDDTILELARRGKLRVQHLEVDPDKPTDACLAPESEAGIACLGPIPMPLDGVSVRPVPGKEKSQVEVTVAETPGWRAVAHDKGHRKGFRIEILGPGDATREVVHTSRGAKRAVAVELAIQELRARRLQARRLAG
jgi:hypothetical protein